MKRAALTQQGENPQRHRLVLELLLDAQTSMNAICAEINDAIVQHDAKGELLKQEAAEASESRAQRETSVALSDDSADDDLPTTPAGVEHRHKKNALQSRLREAHIVLHEIYFRLGDVYHVLGESYSPQETEAYGAAEELRKRLLKSA